MLRIAAHFKFNFAENRRMPIGQNFMISPPENSRIASAYTIGVVTRGIGIGSYVTFSTGVDTYWFSCCWCAV